MAIGIETKSEHKNVQTNKVNKARGQRRTKITLGKGRKRTTDLEIGMNDGMHPSLFFFSSCIKECVYTMYLCHVSQRCFLSFLFVCVIHGSDGTVTQFSAHNIVMARCHSKVGFAQIGNGVEEKKEQAHQPLGLCRSLKITNIPIRMYPSHGPRQLQALLGLCIVIVYARVSFRIGTSVKHTDICWMDFKQVRVKDGIFYCCWRCMAEQALQVGV